MGWALTTDGPRRENINRGALEESGTLKMSYLNLNIQLCLNSEGKQVIGDEVIKLR